MAHRTLQLRRGLKNTLPDPLLSGELGFCTDTREVYIGNVTGTDNILINPLVSLNGNNGIIIKTGSETFTNRTLIGSNGINIADGDGIAGNPTFSPVYGALVDTVCQGNDVRLLTVDENNFIEKYLDKQPDLGIEDLSDEANHCTIFSNRDDDSYVAAYAFKNTIDSSPASDPAIYGTVLDSHSAYEFGVEFSGDLDSHHFDLEWLTFVAGGDIQIGVEDISNASDTVSVTFGSAMANTDYSIVYSIINEDDVNPSQYGRLINAKLTTGFTVELSGNTDSANYKLSWAAQPDNADIQTGTTSISNSSSSVDVTISSYGHTRYVIIPMMINTTDGSPSHYETVITKKSETGFTVDLSSNTDSANYKILWTTAEIKSTGEDFDGGSFSH